MISAVAELRTRSSFVRQRCFTAGSRLFLVVLVLLCALEAEAQTPADAAAPVRPVSLAERVHIDTLEAILRFNYMDVNVDSSAGRVANRDPQYRIRTRARVDLVPAGTTFLRLRTETGRGFDNSWDTVGGAYSPGSFYFNVKSLELGQMVGRQVQFSIGGLEFDHGSGTETTYASGDAPFVGYRFVLNRPEIARVNVTVGAVKDFDESSVFARADDLGDPNYVQILGQRNVTKALDASVEYDSIDSVQFSRQAFHWRNVGGPVNQALNGFIDDVRFEFMQRFTDDFQWAWSAIAGRSFTAARNGHIELIYSHIPLTFFERNGSRFFFNRGEIKQGKRLSIGVSQGLFRDWEVGGFVGRLLDSTPTLRSTAQAYVRYDFARRLDLALHRAKPTTDSVGPKR